MWNQLEKDETEGDTTWIEVGRRVRVCKYEIYVGLECGGWQHGVYSGFTGTVTEVDATHATIHNEKASLLISRRFYPQRSNYYGIRYLEEGKKFEYLD